MASVGILARLTVLNILNAALALLNTLVVAYFYGVGRPVEIFFAAAALYASVMSLTQSGQVTEILIPFYHQLRERQGAAVAFLAYTALVNRLLLILMLLCMLGWQFAPLLAAWRVPGFAPSDIELVSEMFRWILPLILLQVAATLFKTLANAERLYGSPEMVSAVARAVSLVALIGLASHVGPWALVLALWCAVVMEIFGILWLLRRCSYRYSLCLRLPVAATKLRVLGKLAGTFPYVVVTQFYLFVLDAGLSRLATGSFAVFRYASMIWSRSQGVFLRPVSLTFFTEFSEAHARGAGSGKALTLQALARVLAIAALVTTAVLCGAGPVFRGLWEGDRFPSEQIHALVWLLGGFYLMLPVAGTAAILRKMAVSMGCVKETYLALAVVQAISAGLAWILIPLAGLLGALTVAAINLVGFCVAPLLALRLAGHVLELRYPFDRAWRWLLAAVAGVLSAWLVERLLPALGTSMDDRLLSIGAGGLLAAIGVTVAFALSWVLCIPESRLLASRIGRVVVS